MRRWTYLSAGGAAAVLVAMLVWTLFPTVGGGIPNGGRIYACYSNSVGTLRVVDQGTPCKKNESPLSWSQEGSNPPSWYVDYHYPGSGDQRTLTGTPGPASTLLALNGLPGGNYLLTASVQFFNESGSSANGVDAAVQCNLGNRIGGWTIRVPLNGASPSLAGQPGMAENSMSTATITIVAPSDALFLQCWISDWTNKGGASPPPMPTVQFQFGTMTALQLGQVTASS